MVEHDDIFLKYEIHFQGPLFVNEKLKIKITHDKDSMIDLKH